MKNRKSFNGQEMMERIDDARERLEMADMFLNQLDQLKKDIDWLSDEVDALMNRVDHEADIAGEDLINCYREMVDSVFGYA